MQKYKSNALTPKTPASDKEKLIKALTAIEGVNKATLHPSTHEFEIEVKKSATSMPTREVIAAAAKKAGFAIS